VSRWAGPIEDDRWEARTRINARRALRLGWARYLAKFDWQVMATLTFDPRRCEHPGEAHASRETFWWCGLASRLCRRPVGWAYAVEGGGGGWLHAHALLAGCPENLWPAISGAWSARNGRIDLRMVDDREGAAHYLCKSIGPNGEVVLSDTISRHRRAAGAG